MSYNKGQGQFGSRGNVWAMLKSLGLGQGANNPSQQVGFGALQVAKATYDFTVDGGAIGTITPASSPIIPIGAIVLGGILHASVAPTSGGGATLAFGLGSGAQAASLKAATAIATFVINTPVSVLPIWTSGHFKVAADTKITMTIAAATLLTGKIDVHIVYVMGGE